MTMITPEQHAILCQPHLLVVDDDVRLRQLLTRYLAEQGWHVTCAANADDARHKMRLFTVDLMILDMMMPKETGIEFMRHLAQTPPVPPILMLTAMGEAIDRITGLEAGADDYLPKPFEPRELVLRIQKILARTKKIIPREDELIMFGEFRLDLKKKRLFRGADPVHITESEMDILCLLGASLNVAVTRDTLSRAISSEEEEPNPRSVDVLITRLRRKIEPEPSRPVYLQTVRGEGYALRH
jgi:two-component system, OmpR family, phosphate regulon response regulator OmpR